MSAVGHRQDVAATVTGRALVPFVARPPRPSRPSWTAALLVVALGLAAGLGGIGAYGLRDKLSWPVTRDAAIATSTLTQLQGQIIQLQHGIDTLRAAADTARADDGVRGLKRSLEALTQDVAQARASSAATMAALSVKIDKGDREPKDRLADLALRLDRIEKQAAASALPLAPASAVLSRTLPMPAPLPKPVTAMTPAARGGVTSMAATPVAATPNTARPDKPATVGGWVLRDVYDGMALVEARGGGLREIEPGEYLPGAGQVRSIERRGRNWVVMTSRGVIDKATF